MARSGGRIWGGWPISDGPADEGDGRDGVLGKASKCLSHQVLEPQVDGRQQTTSALQPDCKLCYYRVNTCVKRMRDCEFLPHAQSFYAYYSVPISTLLRILLTTMFYSFGNRNLLTSHLKPDIRYYYYVPVLVLEFTVLLYTQPHPQRQPQPSPLHLPSTVLEQLHVVSVE